MENNTVERGIKTVIMIFIIFGIIFLMLKCHSESINLENYKIEKSNDSLKVSFEKLKIFKEKLENRLELANKELLIAQNNSQVSETKLANLQKQRTRPSYVPEIVNCNDTIQSLYNFSLKKDSVCNVTISDKNVEISKLDTIIKIQEKEKLNLTDFVKNKKLETDNFELIVENKNKELFQVKAKKSFWEFFGYAGWLLSGFLAIRK